MSKKKSGIGTEWLQKHIEVIYSNDYARYIKQEGNQRYAYQKEEQVKSKDQEIGRQAAL